MKDHKIEFSTSKKGKYSPFTSPSYRPELDFTNMRDEDLVTVYQNIIGIYRLTRELGRIDILHETLLPSQYLAQPRMGHLQ